MPRACYGDRHAVTVQLGTTKHVAFELTSKVIDFFTTTASVDEKGISLLNEKNCTIKGVSYVTKYCTKKVNVIFKC